MVLQCRTFQNCGPGQRHNVKCFSIPIFPKPMFQNTVKKLSRLQSILERRSKTVLQSIRRLRTALQNSAPKPRLLSVTSSQVSSCVITINYCSTDWQTDNIWRSLLTAVNIYSKHAIFIANFIWSLLVQPGGRICRLKQV